MGGEIKSFFGPNRMYVVCGASNSPHKFGYKILAWYLNHNLPVIPVNPRADKVLGQKTVKSISELIQAHINKAAIEGYDLRNFSGLSISFLTPPNVTRATLEEISKVEGYAEVLKGLWFQPGSYDYEVLEGVEKMGLSSRTIEEDECILVRGEEGLFKASL